MILTIIADIVLLLLAVKVLPRVLDGMEDWTHNYGRYIRHPELEED